jgi:2-polyprenyl-3-methyl-5-hydroxy-6-metoxy-1,4-benzoquinol methylase
MLRETVHRRAGGVRSRVDGVAPDWTERANELSAESIRRGRPTGWFDQLWSEGAAGTVSVPWDHDDPHPLVREWAEARSLDGTGQRAVVVGCGLGAEAEYAASLGFETTGFDLSPAAIGLATERHPGSEVTYVVADLLDLPGEWRGSFDLVVEVYTLQAVPDPPRTDLAAGVRSLVAPDGTLLAVQLRYDGSEPLDSGPPFPQPRELFERTLAQDGLALVALEEVGPHWRAELRRG